jgi:glycosyltransferase involved in cell wall biosynthesis
MTLNPTADPAKRAFEAQCAFDGMLHAPLTIGLLPGSDRFEDFFDKIGVSLETFRDEFTGGWLFNYVRALRLVGVRTVLLFASARVEGAVHFTHADTGVAVWVLPSPRLHKKVQRVQRRFFPESDALAAAASYLATPSWTLARVLRHERCDAIVCQEYEHARFDTCVLLGRLLGLPVFATYQGANQTKTPIERPIRRFSLGRCAGLIIASQAEIARVKGAYGVPSQKIGAIPNPVEVVALEAPERHATRTKLGIGRDTRVVAWHGRVQIDKKGLDVLLDAWDHICSERPDGDILLLLVGTGRDAEVLRHRVASNPRVLWIDRYVFGRRELWSYLLAADLYAIPSRREGFAVAVLEAMACGLPVVASDVPGVAEVIPRGEADGGIVVPREDASALAGALLRLLEDPELRQRFGDVARRRIEREFSLEVIGPRLRRFLFPDHEPERPPNSAPEQQWRPAPEHSLMPRGAERTAPARLEPRPANACLDGLVGHSAGVATGPAVSRLYPPAIGARRRHRGRTRGSDRDLVPELQPEDSNRRRATDGYS